MVPQHRGISASIIHVLIAAIDLNSLLFSLLMAFLQNNLSRLNVVKKYNKVGELIS